MDLFQHACQLDDTARGVLLEETGRDDPDLRGELEDMLSSDAEASGFFSQLDDERHLVAAGERLEGLRLGPYRLRERIGEGGASVVYRAARDDELYEGEVAVKLLRFADLSPELERRFRNERQILAALQHPHIAQLLDGGTTPDGAPYLVMELIAGTRIDAYCDQRDLGVRERLELFLDVCRAVQYAHRQLLVHRDLKPSNILVTGDGTVKLLDFGIAKLLAPDRLAGDWELTRFDERLMTPEYASPEQVRGEAVTTSTDVYALGVLLYKLLTGELPYRMERGGVDELVEAICTLEPKRPSLQVAARGEAERSRLLAGDLDVIVLEALRKEPERRYPSVEALATDVRRQLDGLPIAAREPTLRYRLGKFVGRNRTSVVLGSAAALLGQALVVAMAVQSRRVKRALDTAENEKREAEEARDDAQSAKEAAERQEEKTRAVNRFLLGTLGQADPETGNRPNLTVVEALIDAAERIDEHLSEQPEIAALVRETIGRTLSNLGRYQEAEALLERALADLQRLYTSDHAAIAQTMYSLGVVSQGKGRYEDAEAFYRSSLEMRRRLFGDAHLEVAQGLNELAGVRFDRGDADEALRLHHEALEIRKGLVGDERHPRISESLYGIASCHWISGSFREAETMLRSIHRNDVDVLGPEHMTVASDLSFLASILYDSGFYESGIEAAREAVRILTKHQLPIQQARMSEASLMLALLLIVTGAEEEAETLINGVLAACRGAFGEYHNHVLLAMNHLGVLRQQQGRWNEAERLFREMLTRRVNVFGSGHPQVTSAHEKLGTLLHVMNRHAEARDHLELAMRSFPEARWERARTQSVYGATLHALGYDDEAEQHLWAGLSRLEEVLGTEHRFTREARERWEAFLADRTGGADPPTTERQDARLVE